jgi:hypothetical protein
MGNFQDPQGDRRPQRPQGPQHQYSLSYSGGNDLTLSDIRYLTNPSLATLICYNNSFCYSDLLPLPFAKTLKKLSVGKNVRLHSEEREYESVKMMSIAEGFPALTHLKLNGFKCIKPEFLDVMPRLIDLTVINSPISDIVQSRKYCKRNGIYFNENAE